MIAIVLVALAAFCFIGIPLIRAGYRGAHRGR